MAGIRCGSSAPRCTERVALQPHFRRFFLPNETTRYATVRFRSLIPTATLFMEKNVQKSSLSSQSVSTSLTSLFSRQLLQYQQPLRDQTGPNLLRAGMWSECRSREPPCLDWTHLPLPFIFLLVFPFPPSFRPAGLRLKAVRGIFVFRQDFLQTYNTTYVRRARENPRSFTGASAGGWKVFGVNLSFIIQLKI